MLFDSWFSYPAIIIEIFKIKLKTVARLKKTKNIYYKFEGEKRTLNQIYKSKRKRPERSKYLLSVIATISNDKGNTLDAKLYLLEIEIIRFLYVRSLSTI